MMRQENAKMSNFRRDTLLQELDAFQARRESNFVPLPAFVRGIAT